MKEFYQLEKAEADGIREIAMAMQKALDTGRTKNIRLDDDWTLEQAAKWLLLILGDHEYNSRKVVR